MNVSSHVHTWVYLSVLFMQTINECLSTLPYLSVFITVIHLNNKRISIPEYIFRCHSCEQQRNDSPLVLGSLDRTWRWISDGCWLVSHPATASLQTPCSGHISSRITRQEWCLPTAYTQRHRQLWGTGVRAPSTSSNFIFSSLLE